MKKLPDTQDDWKSLERKKFLERERHRELLESPITREFLHQSDEQRTALLTQ